MFFFMVEDKIQWISTKRLYGFYFTVKHVFPCVSACKLFGLFPRKVKGAKWKTLRDERNWTLHKAWLSHFGCIFFRLSWLHLILPPDFHVTDIDILFFFWPYFVTGGLWLFNVCGNRIFHPLDVYLAHFYPFWPRQSLKNTSVSDQNKSESTPISWKWNIHQFKVLSFFFIKKWSWEGL